jgi:hypothetical protein
MRRTYSILFILFLFSITICAQKDSEAGWKQLTSSEDIFIYQYSSKQITHTPEGTVKFWVKMSPTVEGLIDDKARDQVISLRQQFHLSTKGYDQWGHRLTEYEFDCAQRRFRSLSITDYKKSGRELESKPTTGEWLAVAPESVADEMFKRICALK